MNRQYDNYTAFVVTGAKAIELLDLYAGHADLSEATTIIVRTDDSELIEALANLGCQQVDANIVVVQNNMFGNESVTQLAWHK